MASGWRHVDFYRILEVFGFPAFALVVGVYYGAKGAAKVWHDLVIPFRDTFLGRVTTFFDKLDATLDCTLARHVETIHGGDRREEILMRVSDKVEEVRDQCERIERAVTGQSPPKRPDRSRRQRQQQSQPPPPAPGGSTGSSSTSSAPPP